MNPKFALAFVLLSAAALAASACSGDDGDSNSGLPESSPASQARPTATTSADSEAIELGSSASVFRGNAARTGTYPGSGPSQSPVIKWSRESGGPFVGTPAILNGRLFAPMLAGPFLSLDASTGDKLWSFAGVSGFGFGYSSPTLDEGTIYLTDGGSEAYVYAIESSTGREKWRYRLAGEAGSSPAVQDGVVYVTALADNSRFCSEGGVLHAITAGSGEELWRVTFDSGSPLTPSVQDAAVYVPTCEQDRQAFISASVYAFDSEFGKKLWQTALDGSHAGVAVGKDSVYVGTVAGDDGSLRGSAYSLDAETGEILWRLELPAGTNAPVVTGETVYLTSTTGSGESDRSYVTVVDAKTADRRWQIEMGWGGAVAPTFADGILFFGTLGPAPEGATYGGYVYAVDAAGGTELWRVQTDGEVRSNVLVGDRVVYVGTGRSGNGFVYAIGERSDAEASAAAQAETIVVSFYQRLEQFDTAGMVELVCPDIRDETDSGIGLLQGMLGFGGLFGISPDLELFDFAARTISVEGDTARVQVSGRLGAGPPLGSMTLDSVVGVRRGPGSWCITDTDLLE